MLCPLWGPGVAAPWIELVSPVTLGPRTTPEVMDGPLAAVPGIGAVPGVLTCPAGFKLEPKAALLPGASDCCRACASVTPTPWTELESPVTPGMRATPEVIVAGVA